MNNVIVESRPASPNAITRGHCYARGELGGAVDLRVDCERGVWRISWAVNRGGGFGRGWKTTRATEAEAWGFAAPKWAALVAWLEKLEPVECDGAGAAFSAQVASMMR